MYSRQRKRKVILKDEYYTILKSGKRVLPEARSEKILETLHARIAVASAIPDRKVRVMPMLGWAAAAMVLLVAGALWLYSPAEHTAAPAVFTAKKQEDAVLVRSNNTNAVQVIQLSDKSVVKLSPGSSVSYYASFDTGKRSISLSGKAIFQVAKDSLRPFTVYAGDISITVVGTTFMINTLEYNKVQVKLFEGKVAINSVTPKMVMQEVRLHAGQQFVVDKQSWKFAVTAFMDSIQADRKIISTNTLEFQQEPLANVLARIGKRYNVQFTYREDENFNNMLVTGKFLPSDSLQVVLSMLGTINGLSFNQHNGKIEVTGRQ